MNKRVLMAALLGLAAVGAAAGVQASPESDRQAFREYFFKKFPGVPAEEYANGVYAVDPVGRANWEAIEEFPPYEPAIETGEGLWKKPFANGKGYASCLGKAKGLMAKYPQWDKKRGMVVTLPLALNECREANGEKPLKYAKGPMAELLAYIAFESRGAKTHVVIPKDDPRALEAYEKGKQFYYARRGQLNFSCAHCHVDNAGKSLRTDVLSPALGHTTHWPVYRSKWSEMGTLHRRFKGCNEQVRAKAFKPQGEEYRDLEYFLTYMSNGLSLNGPGARK